MCGEVHVGVWLQRLLQVMLQSMLQVILRFDRAAQWQLQRCVCVLQRCVCVSYGGIPMLQLLLQQHHAVLQPAPLLPAHCNTLHAHAPHPPPPNTHSQWHSLALSRLTARHMTSRHRI